MSSDKYYDDILALITERGELGVNVIARELNAPLSTMQRYLEKQTYFRKTVNRKWDVPDNVDSNLKSNTMSLMVTSVETALLLIDSQMAELQSSIQNALLPVNTLKRNMDSFIAPVADKSGKSVIIDDRLLKIDNEANKVYDIIKKQKDNIPDIYKEMLFNLDYVGMVLGMGEVYAIELLSTDVYAILAGNGDTLPEETIEAIKEYQKGA